MPNKPLKPCAKAGCPLKTRQRYCERHEVSERRSYDRARGSAASRNYGAAWRKLREVVLFEEPICRTPGCNAMTTDVDHIVPRSRGGTDDRENLQGLCHTCHSRKTALEDGRWGTVRRGRG